MERLNANQRIARTADLLQSVETSIMLLRQDAEAARDLIGTDDSDLTDTARKLGKVDGLIHTLQKMEAKLVEFQDRQFGQQRVRDGELDLDAARVEIGCRLARLRNCCGAERISG
jgi:hypothetical protein